MACIGYTYSAAEQDLWIYEDETVSWTGGSAVYGTPIAWNPDSPLYGYRESLQGISCRRRVPSAFASAQLSGTEYTYYSGFNNPADSENYWAFTNSYPMPTYAVSKKFLWTCGHCFSKYAPISRNAATKWSGGVFAAGSANNAQMLFKWIDKDNQVLDSRLTTQVISPFTQDTSPTMAVPAQFDLVISELETPLSFSPLTVVDPRSLKPDATVWFIDSAMKIIRGKMVKAYVQDGIERYQMAYMNPDGTATTSVTPYLHDSGSMWFAEISAPTSAEAGDGVLGVIAAHMVTAYDFTAGTKTGYAELTGVGNLASGSSGITLSSYMTSRGYPMNLIEKANRQHDDLALVSTMDRIVERVNAITFP